MLPGPGHLKDQLLTSMTLLRGPGDLNDDCVLVVTKSSFPITHALGHPAIALHGTAMARPVLFMDDRQLILDA